MKLLNTKGQTIQAEKVITWKFEKNGVALFENKTEIIYMPKAMIQFIKKDINKLETEHILQVLPLHNFTYKDENKRNTDYNTFKAWMDSRG